MKAYTLRELNQMDEIDICMTASELEIEFLEKTKTVIISEILEAQKINELK